MAQENTSVKLYIPKILYRESRHDGNMINT